MFILQDTKTETKNNHRLYTEFKKNDPPSGKPLGIVFKRYMV